MAVDRARLLTLTGVGGAGKTTLAIALARSQTHAFADGVFFVPLASVRTCDNIFSALADTLGTRSTTPTRESFLDYISGRHVLIVLDNLEQIPDAATALADLLAAGRRVSLIATSRRALHVEGEHEFPVEPLALPDSGTLAAEPSPAVRMFCERAAMVKSGFVLTTANASDVADICRRLDGLPLALELAAAQLKVLSPASLLARMQSPMGLRSSTLGRPARQQTLHDAIAWSYELLATTQQQVFRRLGVFAGGFSLDAVDSVALSVEGTDPLDVVLDLVDASLVAVGEDRLGQPRFRLLQTVRSFALEELEHSDDVEATRWRHAEHCRGLAQRLETVRATDLTNEARQQLRVEIENVREVLTWALRPDSATPPSEEQARLGLRISALMANLWFVDNLMSEGRRWLDRALELDLAEQPTWERATALRWLAEFHGWKVADVRPALEESLAIARQLGDQGLECDALIAVGRLEMAQRNFESARELLDQAAALARSLNDRGRMGWSCWFRGWLESDAGQHEAALVLLEDAREQARERGDELGLLMAEAWCVDCLALLGRIDEAKTRLQQIVRDAPEIDNPLWSINALYIGAHICARLEDDERATRLFGAHIGQEAAGGTQIDPAADPQLEESGLTSVRARLGESRWEQALAIGRKYTLSEAFTEILRATDSRSSSGERARRDSNPQPSDP